MMNSIREQIQSMLTVEPRAGGFRAKFKVRPDLSILPDHFKNAPILPGMCMVQAVLIASEISLDLTGLRLSVLKNAKLMHPVLPGEEVFIDGDINSVSPGQYAVKAKIIGGEKRRAEISLVARFENSPEAIPA